MFMYGCKNVRKIRRYTRGERTRLACTFLTRSISHVCRSAHWTSSTALDAPQDPPSHSRTGFSCLIHGTKLVSDRRCTSELHIPCFSLVLFFLTLDKSDRLKALPLFLRRYNLNGLQNAIFRKRSLSFIRKKQSRGKRRLRCRACCLRL